MIKMAIITATRAEYGLLRPVIKELRKRENDLFKLDLIVTGTHLSDQYGYTIKEIDDYIDYQIPVSIKTDTEYDISLNQADTLIKFTALFCREKYDAVILLGDRYEILAVAIAAGNTKTPIFHLCGGDTTEGAIDEWIRHAITKMSYLHFVTNETSRKRVIQLGEDPSRVFNYGSTSIDNIISMKYMTKEGALHSIGLETCDYALCTYHPVTMERGDIDSEIDSLLDVMKACPEIHFIFTKSNADCGGDKINRLLEKAEKSVKNLHVYASLGTVKYLSLMKHAECVLGNSSSGIIEAPALHIPSINIGNRQRGRLQAASILNSSCKKDEIIAAIRIAQSAEYKKTLHSIECPYGNGHAAESIANKSLEIVMNGSINLSKKFYNLCW